MSYIPRQVHYGQQDSASQNELSTVTTNGIGLSVQTQRVRSVITDTITNGVIQYNEEEVLKTMLKKTYEEKIRSNCKFILDYDLLTFQSDNSRNNHISKVVLDHMGIGETVSENERKVIWSKLGPQLKILMKKHRNNLCTALRKVVQNGEK